MRIPVGTSKRLTKKLKGGKWEMRYLWRVFENFWYSARNLGGHAYVQGCAHTQETWQGSSLSTLSSVETLQKQKVKVRKSCKPPDCWMHAQHTHMESLGNYWFIGSRNLKKSLSNHYRTTNWAETSVAAHDKEHRLYRIRPGKSQNKQISSSSCSSNHHNK